MANYLTTDADLTSVANAIRTKGGTSASLAFPADFVSAIAAIPSGGGGTEITTAGDYTINAGDTITMGTGLTGALTASGQRVLTNSWDFTSGLVDSVGGLTATLGNGATQSSSGVTIDASNKYVQIPVHFSAGKTYEIDFASVSKTFSSGHGRVFMWSGGEGFIANGGSTWRVYANGAWATSAGTNLTVFSGKTLRVTTHPFPRLINGVQTDYISLKLYIDGVLWYEPDCLQKVSSAYSEYVRLGQDSSAFATMVITGFRVYNGVNV